MGFTGKYCAVTRADMLRIMGFLLARFEMEAKGSRILEPVMGILLVTEDGYDFVGLILLIVCFFCNSDSTTIIIVSSLKDWSLLACWRGVSAQFSCKGSTML